jgi:hypothetical protein
MAAHVSHDDRRHHRYNQTLMRRRSSLILTALAYLSLALCGTLIVLWITGRPDGDRYVISFDTRADNGLFTQNNFGVILWPGGGFRASSYHWIRWNSYRLRVPYWAAIGATAIWPIIWLGFLRPKLNRQERQMFPVIVDTTRISQESTRPPLPGHAV